MNSMLSAKSWSFSIIGFMLMALIRYSNGQGMAPSPALAGPSNDGEYIHWKCIFLFVKHVVLLMKTVRNSRFVATSSFSISVVKIGRNC